MKYYASIQLEIDAEDDDAAENTVNLARRGAEVYGVVDAYVLDYPEPHEPEEG